MRSYQQVSAELVEFYRKPFASISMELILTMMLILVLVTAVIRPTLTTMSELSRELEEKEELLEKLEKKSTSLATAQSVYLSALPRLPLLEEAMPVQESLITDLKTIEKMIGFNTMIINNLGLMNLPSTDVNQTTNKPVAKTDNNTSPKQEADLVVTIPISLSIGGDYLSIRDFVREVINYRRLYVIKSITFNIDKNKDIQALSAQLTIEAPFEVN